MANELFGLVDDYLGDLRGCKEPAVTPAFVEAVSDGIDATEAILDGLERAGVSRREIVMATARPDATDKIAQLVREACARG